MSSNDRAAKARDKAFRRLARIRAEHQHYARELDPEPLASWLANDVQENKGEWTFVWDRALRYADRWWDEQLAEVRKHLDEARGKAVIVSLDLVEAQRKVTDQERAVQQQAGIIERQRENNRTLFNENVRLRDERTSLQDELKETKAQLEMTRKHTTSATWKVFEENERLVAELRRVTSLLADEEERVSQRDDKIHTLEALNESLKVFNEDCMQKRDGLLTVLAEEKTLTGDLRREVATLRDRLEEATRPRPVLCGATDPTRAHSCIRLPGAHRQHACHCNELWVNELLTR